MGMGLVMRARLPILEPTASMVSVLETVMMVMQRFHRMQQRFVMVSTTTVILVSMVLTPSTNYVVF